MDGTVYDTSVGKSGVGGLSIRDPGFDCAVFHNHPDNRIFSGPDIETFLSSGDIQVFSAIGNNGSSSFTLVKGNKYDGLEANRAFYPLITELDKHRLNRDLDSYLATIEHFLEGAGKYGIAFERSGA